MFNRNLSKIELQTLIKRIVTLDYSIKKFNSIQE